MVWDNSSGLSSQFALKVISGKETMAQEWVNAINGIQDERRQKLGHLETAVSQEHALENVPAIDKMLLWAATGAKPQPVLKRQNPNDSSWREEDQGDGG